MLRRSRLGPPEQSNLALEDRRAQSRRQGAQHRWLDLDPSLCLRGGGRISRLWYGSQPLGLPQRQRRRPLRKPEGQSGLRSDGRAAQDPLEPRGTLSDRSVLRSTHPR
jgi:hypothetical protein